MYRPTIFDFSMLFGTVGLFLTLIFLFIRFLPMIAIFEMKTLLPESKATEAAPHSSKENPVLPKAGGPQESLA
jgi:molybdopterin-containing oxidoreductase family membrane subunit